MPRATQVAAKANAAGRDLGLVTGSTGLHMHRRVNDTRAAIAEALRARHAIKTGVRGESTRTRDKSTKTPRKQSGIVSSRTSAIAPNAATIAVASRPSRRSCRRRSRLHTAIRCAIKLMRGGWPLNLTKTGAVRRHARMATSCGAAIGTRVTVIRIATRAAAVAGAGTTGGAAGLQIGHGRVRRATATIAAVTRIATRAVVAAGRTVDGLQTGHGRVRRATATIAAVTRIATRAVVVAATTADGLQTGRGRVRRATATIAVVTRTATRAVVGVAMIVDDLQTGRGLVRRATATIVAVTRIATRAVVGAARTADDLQTGPGTVRRATATIVAVTRTATHAVVRAGTSAGAADLQIDRGVALATIAAAEAADLAARSHGALRPVAVGARTVVLVCAANRGARNPEAHRERMSDLVNRGPAANRGAQVPATGRRSATAHTNVAATTTSDRLAPFSEAMTTLPAAR